LVLATAINAASAATQSLWMSVEVDHSAATLKANAHCDVVIVGSGIAGLSAAYELVSQGLSVIVLERGTIAGGMTSRTTAHLAPVCDDALSELIKMRGEETARLFQSSQEAAVTRIEEIVSVLNIQCNFRRLDGYLFPSIDMDFKEAREQCDQEYKAGRKAGAAVERVKGVPLRGMEDAPALRYPNQATFHPLKYLNRLAAEIRNKRGQLFAHSPVLKIVEVTNGVAVTTANGSTVHAGKAVIATNGPINNTVKLHSKMAPYRTYAMAFTIPKDTLPDALYWDMADPYHYVRLNPGPGTSDYLIAGGADHKSGEANDGNVRFEAIEAWIRALVPNLGKEVNRWSGQVLDTIDYCGFIGKNPGNKNIFVATGDSGQGITHGVVAGVLIRDLIVNGSSPWESVYRPSRKTPKGVLNYLRENATAVKSFGRFVAPGELSSSAELKPGEGGILRRGLRKTAVCRDRDGKLHFNAALCTHLGCHIQWNSTEQCWDCPCHGSQFAPDGAVINGPAIFPLKKMERL
jgi:glycine/D-amino acid oxidase-like deaminating enzyme/nitrite reductase/ring-hydroxylating ferredoxin subunit